MGWVNLGNVESSQVELSVVGFGWVRLARVGSGQIRWGCIMLGEWSGGREGEGTRGVKGWEGENKERKKTDYDLKNCGARNLSRKCFG